MLIQVRFALATLSFALVSSVAVAESTSVQSLALPVRGSASVGQGPVLVSTNNAYNELAANLTLNWDQKNKIAELFKAEKATVKAIREDQSLTSEQKRTKRNALLEETWLQVGSVVAPEQRAVVTEVKKGIEELNHRNWLESRKQPAKADGK